jgi:hypothetical protein
VASSGSAVLRPAWQLKLLPISRLGSVERMPWSGLEPLCLSAPPPQDGVSTNFTTRADLESASAIPNPNLASKNTGPTGLEPATSRVTVECSNQTELRPQLWSQGRIPLPHCRTSIGLFVSQSFLPRFFASPFSHSPKGNRTPLCTVKGCRPNR